MADNVVFLVDIKVELVKTIEPYRLVSCSRVLRLNIADFDGCVSSEGLAISKMSPSQREEVWAIVRAFNVYLPEAALEARMKRLQSFEDQTYFAWIGKFGLGDPYYFRIHSPMTFCEVRRMELVGCQFRTLTRLLFSV